LPSKDSELIALTPYPITTAAALRSKLTIERQCSYALDDRENQANMRCIAVPIQDGESRAVAVLSAADDVVRMTLERQLKIRDTLFETAATLWQKLYSVATLQQYRRPIAAEQSAQLESSSQYECGVVYGPPSASMTPQ